MAIRIQCPAPACRATCSAADTVSGHAVKCPKCGKTYVAKPTLDGQGSDTQKSRPAPNEDPFPDLPAEFGRYRVLRLLGRGGMGAVYLAQDSQLGRQVALKIPFIDASKPQRLQRFAREARSAAALHHPNICTVFDSGEIEGRPFITMAYIEGAPLEGEIDAGAPVPQPRAAEIVRKVALALDYAHRTGTVHRDLKPANVMMRADGEPVVMDFGLAKQVAAADPDASRLTHDGGIMGTPTYMSPEQVRGDVAAIGPVSDVYALGVMLFELLAGTPPYIGPVAVVLGQIMSAPVPSVREFRPDADPRLDAICQRAMAKDPADCFASMAELAEALDVYLKPSAPPAHVSPTARVAPAPQLLPVLELDDVAAPARPPERRTGRRPAVAALGLALVPLLVWLAVVVLRVETPSGTILVEIDDPAVGARIKNGNLVLSGPDGTDRYTLAPGESTKAIAAGEYKIRVAGADGLALDTNEFTLKKGDTVTVRVRAVPPAAPKDPVVAKKDGPGAAAAAAVAFGPETTEWAGTVTVTDAGGAKQVGGTWTFTERRGKAFKGLWRSSNLFKTTFEGTIDAEGRIRFLAREQLSAGTPREEIKGDGEIANKRMSFVIEELDGSSKARVELKRLADGGKGFDFGARWKVHHLPRNWTGFSTVVDDKILKTHNGTPTPYTRDGGLIMVVYPDTGREWLIIDPDRPDELTGSFTRNGVTQNSTWIRQ